jgi:hypothetical protein
VEAPLDMLVRAGFLRRSTPIGAPKGAKPFYEIGDPYLSFWFACLYANQTEIEAGQGRAVLARIGPLWQRHIGWVFEQAARAHAVRMVARGILPRNLVVGRWWATTGPACEVDILGLHGSKTALLGEARWQPRPLDMRDADELRRKIDRVPPPSGQLLLALWGRKGATLQARRAGVLGFGLKDVLAP